MAVSKKTAVYEDFIDGAFEGMKIVAELVPTLIGLFMAVRILNDSGALTIITTALKPLSSLLNTPDCVIPCYYYQIIFLRFCHKPDAKYFRK